ncbi:MAG: hypothetical protein AB1894_11360 [Chloroflexota bacterium]
MKTTQTLGILAFTLAIMTTLFLVLFITDMASAGPLDTFGQVLAHVSRQSWLSLVAYANVTLLTAVATIFFAGLYVYCRADAPLASAAAVIFVPVYSVFNFFAYFSQITVIPRMLELHHMPEYQAMASFWLRQLLQTGPGSAVSIFNNFAYAILGIPSIIFGVLLYRMYPSARLGALLFALSGVASMLGIIGFVVDSALLSWGSMVGAVFFLLSLPPLGWSFWRQP